MGDGSKITGKFGAMAFGAILTSGSLTIGVRYRIVNFVSSDDFTNVGAASNASGVEFVASGTTPTTWSHSSALLAIPYKITDFEISTKLGTTNVSDSGDAAVGWAVKVPQTFKEWSGKLTAFYLKGIPTPSLGDKGTTTFVADSGITFVGDVLLTDVSAKIEIAGTNAVKVDATFEGTGALTETNS